MGTGNIYPIILTEAADTLILFVHGLPLNLGFASSMEKGAHDNHHQSYICCLKSLTTIPYKILEGEIKKAILVNLLRFKPINDSQPGFLPEWSCTTNMFPTLVVSLRMLFSLTSLLRQRRQHEDKAFECWNPRNLRFYATGYLDAFWMIERHSPAFRSAVNCIDIHLQFIWLCIPVFRVISAKEQLTAQVLWEIIHVDYG